MALNILVLVMSAAGPTWFGSWAGDACGATVSQDERHRQEGTRRNGDMVIVVSEDVGQVIIVQRMICAPCHMPIACSISLL